jgi:hypothetical protein
MANFPFLFRFLFETLLISRTLSLVGSNPALLAIFSFSGYPRLNAIMTYSFQLGCPQYNTPTIDKCQYVLIWSCVVFILKWGQLIMKKCNICYMLKPFTEFYTAKSNRDGLMHECKKCNNKRTANYRKITKYELARNHHDIERIFNQHYYNMKSRTTGKRYRRKGEKYKVYGKDLMSKEEFIEWCYKPEIFLEFKRLYKQWVISNFNIKFCPSIDRIDNTKSYVLGNIQWLTHIDNTIKRVK